MKAQFKLKSGNLLFEIIGETARELWSQMAQIEELFEAESECGLCQSKNLRHGHRVTKNGGFHYYELVCRDCGAVFQFGQVRATREIYPRRKDKQGVALPNRGWKKWNERLADDPDDGDYGPPDQGYGPPEPPPPPRQAQAPQPQRSAPPAGNAQSARDLKYERDHSHDYPPIDEPPARRR